MTGAREILIGRLREYKRRSEILRQIHSDKAFRYQRYSNIQNLFGIVVSAFVTFLGFMGIDTIYNLIQPLMSIRKEWVNFTFNILVLIILIIIVTNLIYRFQEKSGTHNRSIVILTGFICELDDLITLQYFDDNELDIIANRNTEKYKMITEILPPSTDKEFLHSKRVYLQKKEQSMAIQAGES